MLRGAWPRAELDLRVLVDPRAEIAAEDPDVVGAEPDHSRIDADERDVMGIATADRDSALVSLAPDSCVPRRHAAHRDVLCAVESKAIVLGARVADDHTRSGHLADVHVRRSRAGLTVESLRGVVTTCDVDRVARRSDVIGAVEAPTRSLSRAGIRIRSLGSDEDAGRLEWLRRALSGRCEREGDGDAYEQRAEPSDSLRRIRLAARRRVSSGYQKSGNWERGRIAGRAAAGLLVSARRLSPVARATPS